MVIRCNIFLLDKEVLQQEQALDLDLGSRSNYDIKCPFFVDTDDISTISANLDEDEIPTPTAMITLKNGHDYEIDIPYLDLAALKWGKTILE